MSSNADAENKRLVLSAREILREKADEERKAKVSNVQVGLVTEGTVETIKPTVHLSTLEMACPVCCTFLRSAKNVSKHRLAVSVRR